MTHWRLVGRVAVLLALTPDRRRLWRQAGLVVASAVAALLLLGTTAVLVAFDAGEERNRHRIPATAENEADAHAWLSLRGPIIDGQQATVVWLSPAAGFENDPAIIPPGLWRLPAPGTAVVSPGLLDAGRSAESLGFGASDAGTGVGGTIGDEGLRTPSERYVYARPAPGRDLGHGGNVWPVLGYGRPTDNPPVDMGSPSFPPRDDLIYALIVLGAPVMVFLAGAARAMSPVRRERARLLGLLGLPHGVIRGIFFVEAAVLAMLPMPLVLALWWFFLRDVVEIPGSQTVLAPGALHLSPLCVFADMAAVILIGATASASGPLMSGRSRRMPALLWSTPRFAAAGYAAAVCAMWTGMLMSPLSGARIWLMLGGLLVAAATLPAALRALAGGIGRLVVRVPRPVPWLAGHRLVADAGDLVRPGAAVGVFVLLMTVGLSMVALMNVSDDAAETGEYLPQVAISWRGERPGDLAFVRSRFPEAVMAVPLDDGNAGAGAAIGRQSLVFEDCAAVVRALGGSQRCEEAKTLPVGVVADAQRRLGITPSVATTTAGVPYSAVLFPTAPVAEDAVMQRLGGRLPALDVSASGPLPNQVGVRPAWMTVSLWVAAAVSLLAFLREVVDRMIVAQRDDARLLEHGLSPRDIEAVGHVIMTPLLLGSAVLGLVAGWSFAVVGRPVGVTDTVLLTVVCAAGVVVVLTWLTWAIGLRMCSRAMVHER